MIKKRSVRINGHPTSITMEEPFWGALKHIAFMQNLSMAQLITQIDHHRCGDGATTTHNLSSVLRCYVLDWYKNHTDNTPLD